MGGAVRPTRALGRRLSHRAAFGALTARSHWRTAMQARSSAATFGPNARATMASTRARTVPVIHSTRHGRRFAGRCPWIALRTVSALCHSPCASGGCTQCRAARPSLSAPTWPPAVPQPPSGITGRTNRSTAPARVRARRSRPAGRRAASGSSRLPRRRTARHAA